MFVYPPDEADAFEEVLLDGCEADVLLDVLSEGADVDEVALCEAVEEELLDGFEETSGSGFVHTPPGRIT